MTGKHDSLSIWFFIGGLLAVYGVLITGASLYQYANPVATKVVLAELHAGIWWGAFMLVLGIVYLWNFRPGR